nr:4'-phosphopantetheinyl transferase superfamily protein [Kitasatospora sp. SID7827]
MRDARAAIGEPIAVAPGPASGWERVREALAVRGSAVLVARLGEWLPAAGADPAPETGYRAVLGRDWNRYRAITHSQVRERFLASRMLLKRAAGEALQAPPESVDLAYKLGGRPYLRGCDQVDISLSHTAELLVVGLTRRGWIGVDTELDDRVLLGTGAEKQICTPYEAGQLAAMAEHRRNPALVRLWTLKEAYSKAIGQGLRFRFTEFGFTSEEAPVTVLRPDGSPGTGEEWSFGTWAVDGYTVSVALFDAGFGDAADIAALTMLDDGLVDALIGGPGRGPDSPT